MLEFYNLSKAYAERQIFTITNSTWQNDIYWIQGSNGSGKTTFLKAIAGLINIEGDIIFNKVSIKKQPVEYRKQISWAEAEPLYPEFLTGKELIDLYKNIRGVNENEISRITDAFDVRSFINNPVGSYSTGMLKKLSLALAFIGDAKLIILDEPLITLDTKSFETVCSLISERHKTNNTMFLLSSHHDLDTPLLLPGKTAIVKDQKIKLV